MMDLICELNLSNGIPGPTILQVNYTVEVYHKDKSKFLMKWFDGRVCSSLYSTRKSVNCTI